LEEGYDLIKCPANWNRFGKSAGYRRNAIMASLATHAILFPGGRGTEHMRRLAASKNLTIIEYKEEN
jgi:hypothetical protein